MIIKRPIITEKLTQLQDEYNRYSFVVDRNATKADVKNEIERLYPEVKVTKINTMIMPSKPKGRYTKGGSSVDVPKNGRRR
ncbi:MAG TPA: 50S ribosomal protein L23 [Bacteroidales bacterium]|nr:50S ribosomal protein L23 [Bacteroidales bacterium]